MILQEKDHDAAPNSSEIHSAAELLHRRSMGFLVDEWFMQELRRALQGKIVSEFWAHFHPIPLNSSICSQEDIRTFTAAVDFLHNSLDPYMKSALVLQNISHLTTNPLKVNRSPISERVHTLIKAILFSRVPKSFHGHVKQFYSQAFKVCLNKQLVFLIKYMNK